jgi:hypothetical protein
LYALLRPQVANDLTALALASLLPLLWTAAQAVRRRRVNWISGLSLLGFAAALGISVVSGGSPLALELRETVVATLLGLACLLSILVGKPVLQVLPRLLGRGEHTLPTDVAKRLNDPAGTKRANRFTAVVGVALLVKAVIDLVLALSLPTDAFLATARLFNWAIIGGLVMFLYWVRHRSGGFGSAL